MEETEDRGRYAVVFNEEEQYSVWPHDREPPAGWRRDGTEGTREECLAHIAEVWTDITPKSLREAYAADAARVRSTT